MPTEGANEKGLPKRAHTHKHKDTQEQKKKDIHRRTLYGKGGEDVYIRMLSLGVSCFLLGEDSRKGCTHPTFSEKDTKGPLPFPTTHLGHRGDHKAEETERDYDAARLASLPQTKWRAGTSAQ